MQDTVIRWFVSLVRLDIQYFMKETKGLKYRYNGQTQKTTIEKQY